MLNPRDSKHQGARGVLRVVGPMLVVIGLIFIIIGGVSFFSSFGSFGPPKYFWCMFVGMPLLFVGGVMCKLGYLGAISRYLANEVSPVGKDVVNYVARGTQSAVRDVTSAISQGLRDGASADSSQAVQCPKCSADNDADAKFCDACGTALIQSKSCESCGEQNDGDARFCDNCGQAMP